MRLKKSELKKVFELFTDHDNECAANDIKCPEELDCFECFYNWIKDITEVEKIHL